MSSDKSEIKVCHKNVQTTENKARLINSIIILFLCITLLFLSVIGAVIIFAFEIREMKSETASLEKASSEINTSLHVLVKDLERPESSSVHQMHKRSLLGKTSCTQCTANVQHLNKTLLTFYEELSSIDTSVHDSIQQMNKSLSTLSRHHSVFQEDVSNKFSSTDHSLQQVKRLWNVTQQIHSDLKNLIQVSALSSCTDLPSTASSGFYYIRTTNGSIVHKYCDRSRSCGGVPGSWRKIAALDMTDTSQTCPNPLIQTNYSSNLRTCSRQDRGPGCTSVRFSANNLPYTRICGSVIAYQKGLLEAFRFYNNERYLRRRAMTIDEFYVFGVSVTRGTPRQHVWTFAAARDELVTHNWSGCTCLRPNYPIPPTPPYVGNDYFCDTGSESYVDYTTFHDDPLWDGAGCTSLRGFNNSCCSFNNPPWFHKHLSQPTTDDIELRFCRHNIIYGDLAVKKFEIYVE